MFMTLNDMVFGHFVMLINETHNRPPTSGDNSREEKNGRKLVGAITAESIYRCMLLFPDHILYRRAVLAIMFSIGIFHYVIISRGTFKLETKYGGLRVTFYWTLPMQKK